jgi:hypothetical protein
MSITAEGDHELCALLRGLGRQRDPGIPCCGGVSLQIEASAERLDDLLARSFREAAGVRIDDQYRVRAPPRGYHHPPEAT